MTPYAIDIYVSMITDHCRLPCFLMNVTVFDYILQDFLLLSKTRQKVLFFGQFEKKLHFAHLLGKARPCITIKPQTQHFQKFRKFRKSEKIPKNTFLGQSEKKP